MKSILFLLTIALFTSCADDDSNAPRTKLLRSLEITSADEDISYSYTFQYDGQDRIQKIICVGNTGDWEAILGYNDDHSIATLSYDSQNFEDRTYTFIYEQPGILSGMTLNGFSSEIFYNAQTRTYSGNFPTFTLYANGDFNASDSRYFSYEPSKKGPFFNSPSAYHLLSVFLYEIAPEFETFATKSPITMINYSNISNFQFENDYAEDAFISHAQFIGDNIIDYDFHY